MEQITPTQNKISIFHVKKHKNSVPNTSLHAVPHNDTYKLAYFKKEKLVLRWESPLDRDTKINVNVFKPDNEDFIRIGMEGHREDYGIVASQGSTSVTFLVRIDPHIIQGKHTVFDITLSFEGYRGNMFLVGN
jgi:hypothetical protein